MFGNDSLNILSDSNFPCGFKRKGMCSRKDLKSVMEAVGKILDDKHWPANDIRLARACMELAGVCDKFIKYGGERVARSAAIATGIPLHDDGCPLKAHVGADGEKVYTSEDIEAARQHYASCDPTGGRVFVMSEMADYVNSLTDGRVKTESLQVAAFVTLGYRSEHWIPLYRERDVWNALRIKFRQVITMDIVNMSQTRGGKDGWEA